MYKKITTALLVVLVVWATIDAFVVNHDGFYSSISRGKLIGIILVIVLLPFIYAVHLYIKTYIRTHDHNTARKTAMNFLKDWVKMFFITKKKGRNKKT